MKPVLLMSGNFVREQRWPLVAMLAYVAMLGSVVLAERPRADDVLFLLRSLAIYGVAFAALLGSAAIYNDRRSRRVLSVLSKGISRAQYLGGIMAGIAWVQVIYCLSVAIILGLLPARDSFNSAGYLMVVFCGQLIAASVVLFFSTFLHPLLAVGAGAVLLVATGLLGNPQQFAWANLLPGATLLDALAGYISPWPAVISAAVYAGLFWVGAVGIFAHRDIAAAVE